MSEMTTMLTWAEILFGVLYAIFGKGPDIPDTPPFMRAIMRLVTPVLMFGVALYQSGVRKERACVFTATK